MEAVHAEWKEYLNLLICEESHLKYMEDYHQFHKDMKDAQELLHKVDSDLNQKYSPDFKDRYQLELLLRELDVSGSCEVPCQTGHRSPHLPGPEQTISSARLGLLLGRGSWPYLVLCRSYRTRRRLWTSMRMWCGDCRGERSKWYHSSTAARHRSSPSLWRPSATLRVTRSVTTRL